MTHGATIACMVATLGLIGIGGQQIANLAHERQTEAAAATESIPRLTEYWQCKADTLPTLFRGGYENAAASRCLRNPLFSNADLVALYNETRGWSASEGIKAERMREIVANGGLR